MGPSALGIRKKCVIFDMDGCLIDTERAYLRAWDMAFRSKGIPISQEMLVSFAGKGVVYINEKITEYTHSEQLAKELRAIREDFFWEFLDMGEVGLMPYAREILDYIKGVNLILGIASSTAAPKAERTLRHFGLLGYFDIKVFGDMIARLKPAPDIYDKAVCLSGRAKAECIAFEDSAPGVMSANACGIDVVYVPGIGRRVSDEAVVYKEIPSLKEGISLLAGVI